MTPLDRRRARVEFLEGVLRGLDRQQAAAEERAMLADPDFLTLARTLVASDGGPIDRGMGPGECCDDGPVVAARRLPGTGYGGKNIGKGGRPKGGEKPGGKAPGGEKPKPKAGTGSKPAPKEEPKAEPKPHGTPVSHALHNATKGKTQAAVKETIDAIDRIHGDGVLPKIPIVQSSGDRTVGLFRYNGLTGRPVEIKVSSRGEHPRMTAAHEIGHFIEHSGIPKAFGGPRIFANSPEMKPWLDAVKASKAYKELARLQSGPGAIKMTAADGKEITYSLDRKYVGYLLQNNELWARSYAQYVAHKSGNTEFKRELDAERSRGGPYRHNQWDDDDFAPIGKAMDDMFKGLGWMK